MFYRYRHGMAVLLVAIIAQLGLLAYQVRNDKDVRGLIRSVGGERRYPLCPRSGRSSDLERPILSTTITLLLLDVRKDNQRLKKDSGCVSARSAAHACRA